jgi:hypothetical protein
MALVVVADIWFTERKPRTKGEPYWPEPQESEDEEE